MTYTTINGVYGYLYTGIKPGYTNKSIFIPSNSIWTSEVNGTATNSYAYYYSPGNTSTSSYYRYNGYYIRPVYGGNVELSDGQRVNLNNNGRVKNTDETLTLNGSLMGLTSGMNVTKVGFVVSDAETVGISTAADYDITGTLAADGTFTGTLQAGYADSYDPEGRAYMRAYAVINGQTYYSDVKSWKLSAQATEIETITMSTSGTQEMDLSDYSEITIEHLYDNGGATGQYSHGSTAYIKLIAAEGCTWKITGSVATESCCDWVSVYDGPTPTPTSPYDSGYTVKWNGTLTANFQSTSNVIYVCFRSDGSVTGNGFDLQLKAE